MWAVIKEQKQNTFNSNSVHILNFAFLSFTAQQPNQTITLTFTSFNTECSFDFLFIYDGASYNSPVIGTFTGNSLPDVVVAWSGNVSIELLFIIILIFYRVSKITH